MCWGEGVDASVYLCLLANTGTKWSNHRKLSVNELKENQMCFYDKSLGLWSMNLCIHQ